MVYKADLCFTRHWVHFCGSKKASIPLKERTMPASGNFPQNIGGPLPSAKLTWTFLLSLNNWIKIQSKRFYSHGRWMLYLIFSSFITFGKPFQPGLFCTFNQNTLYTIHVNIRLLWLCAFDMQFQFDQRISAAKIYQRLFFPLKAIILNEVFGSFPLCTGKIP